MFVKAIGGAAQNERRLFGLGQAYSFRNRLNLFPLNSIGHKCYTNINF